MCWQTTPAASLIDTSFGIVSIVSGGMSTETSFLDPFPAWYANLKSWSVFWRLSILSKWGGLVRPFASHCVIKVISNMYIQAMWKRLYLQSNDKKIPTHNIVGYMSDAAVCNFVSYISCGQCAVVAASVSLQLEHFTVVIAVGIIISPTASEIAAR